MRWFDVDEDTILFLKNIRSMFYWWSKIPNSKRRIEFLKQNRDEARLLLKSARKRDEWLAKYENRPKKNDKELVDDILEDIHRK